jgi:PAS domain S-box-containing protein
MGYNIESLNQNRAVKHFEALQHHQTPNTGPELAFHRITALIENVFAVPTVFITLVDRDSQMVTACYGRNTKKLSFKHSFCEFALQNEKVMVIPDTAQDIRFADNLLVTGEPHLRFYAGAPLKTSSGYTLGTLSLFGTEPNTSFGQLQHVMLANFAAMVVDELKLRLADQGLQASKARYRTVNEAASDTVVTMDMENTINYINPAATKTFGHPLDDMLGKNLSMLMPEYSRHMHEAGTKHYTETGHRDLSWETVEIPGFTRITTRSTSRSPSVKICRTSSTFIPQSSGISPSASRKRKRNERYTRVNEMPSSTQSRRTSASLF